ncbi:fasciclin-3 isoform X2 [Pectinophora gossypiella]|uniref:fasciclin-3 isoform X2 n=1 Tax=Pectinophora gossypiella TaxID=13191 RepID=UPI00214E6A85|nr:fasciclin-3 isoform X2 [Pectinophora gossypiella]
MFVPALFGLLLAALVTGQTVEITPREAVRRVGSDLTVLCKVPYAIDSCRMTVGTMPYRLLPGTQDENVMYAGQGLQVGECGGHIRNIREEWNGNITCVLPPRTGSIELTATMRLLVARAPDAPQLLSPQEAIFREGETFDAQCVVPNGRPAARITWFLDSEPLLVGVHQAVVEQEPGSDLQTIKQNVTRALRADDAGRRLVCMVEHEALDKPREASRQLNVHYPPKRADGDSSSQITIFGLKLGGEGRLNVTVRASPPPTAEWTVADQRLIAPQQSDDGTVTALQPVPLGGGYYNVTLILRRVSKEDVERSYYLRVHNELGRDEFAVRISTMDEPAGVELDTGAIVGIVVAVLALLIGVFLIVFAKATDRWCFAGDRSRDHAKNSGESTPAGTVLLSGLAARTDTESAVGGGGRADRAAGRLAALGARVRAALPRGRDKVQAAERADEDKPADEKKGVVYAELALGEAPAGDKPPPPATEYAEIVYTEGQKETKE